MKALFLTFTNFSKNTGVGQKIQSQIEAIRSLGYTSVLYGKLNDINEFFIENEKFGKFPSLRNRKESKAFYQRVYEFIMLNGISFIYYRFNAFSNPDAISFFKRLKESGIKQVVEIPTYPYDGETNPWNRSVVIDKLTRRILMRQFDYVVTFSTKSKIFGHRTINISNGVDFDKLPLIYKKEHTGINLLGVANLTSWHGFDRIIDGLLRYYNGQPKTIVRFHIVSGKETPYITDLKRYVESKKLSDKVIFHGEVNGGDLDELFNECDLAIGSLGRHRNGIVHLKTLKNVEYAARGVPFVYSEINEDFDEKPYISKIIPNDSPIDIDSLIDFIGSVEVTSEEIRESVKHLSWKNQFTNIHSILHNDQKNF